MKVAGHRSQIIFDCDFLLSLPLAGWPSPAMEWITRERAWPCKEVVDWLVKLPTHVIPKPRSEGDEESWRFSFSRQEIEISNILPHNARLCYIGLKIIIKKYIKTIFSGLKSYHMLTLFLWFMEEQEPHVWGGKDAFNGNFKCLMKFVAKHLENDDIPHYFIRSLNLVSMMKI